MAEINRAEVYLAYLDRILAGEDIGPVEDTEIGKLLQLAKKMIAADFSVNSKIRDTLRKQLLGQISSDDGPLPAAMFKDNQQADDELTEEDLTYVAAGLAGEGGENICPRCGARFNRMQGKCRVCHY